MRSHYLFFALILAAAIATSESAFAGTKVRIATKGGNIDLELYDQDKPVTVGNFLKYIKSGRYSGTFIHRLVPGFIVQGGGYGLTGNSTDGYTVTGVTAYDPIVNEYAVGRTYSNTYGTIAMAKLPAEDSDGNPIAGGGPDSATSEWFLNLGDNSANLDSQNGGFTVFGRVIAGMDVLASFNTAFVNQGTGGVGVYDASSSLGTAFTNMPLLAGSLEFGNLIFSEITILPDPTPESEAPPTIKIKGGKTVKVTGSSAKIGGKGSSSVAKVEWRVGRKGKFRSHAAGSSWKIKVTKLKPGRNMVYVRAVSAGGIPGPLQKVSVVRQ
jgi:cyclophilin family peptidyl-prolyl cis-trans isomerase